MAISLYGTSTSLFARIGKLGKVLKDMRNAQRVNLVPEIQAAYATLDSVPAAQAILANAQNSCQGMGVGLASTLQSCAASLVTTMAHADRPLSNPNSVPEALGRVITQMLASVDSVTACAVTATVTPSATIHGTGSVIATVLGGDGLTLANSFAESADMTYGSSAFAWKGAAPAPGVFDSTWPTGSGGSASLSAGTQIAGGTFETWTAGTPSGWVVSAGVAGTGITSSATAYLGTKSASFQANAVQIDQASGRSQQPLATLAVGGWVRKLGAPTGNLFFELLKSDGTVSSDKAGTANRVTVAVGSMTTSFAFFGGFFRTTPDAADSPYKLSVRFAGTASVGNTVLVDQVAVLAPSALYRAGPAAASFDGSTPFRPGDVVNVAVTNDRGGATDLATFQTLLDRLFNMRGLGLQLPYSGAPTVSDTLIS